MAKTGEILTGLIIATGVGIAAYTYSQQHMAQAGRNLRLKIVNVGLDGTDIVLSVKILNPNSKDMEVQSFVGEMYADNKPVADIQMFGDYIAKANNQITIPLVARPKAVNLFQVLVNMFRTGNVQIRFTGTINVNNKAIPLMLSYTKQ